MTLASNIANIRRAHQDCCLTDCYTDEGCGLDVRDIPLASLTTIHGSHHQARHNRPGRLCDRVIIGESGDGFVCAVEFKGGNNIDMSGAIEQIQGGLRLAAELLPGQPPGKWHPLLLYSGSMGPREKDLLRKTRVGYKGSKALVDRLNCGASLLNYLNRN